MNVLLIGANGQLGTDLHRVFLEQGMGVIPMTHAELELCDPKQVSGVMDSLRPDMIVNTAAFHKVEECEKQPQRAFEVNAVAVRNLALACERQNAVLVHFSTDYVFGGKTQRPYCETDLPEPLNVYGASKLGGEHLVMSNTKRHFVIRTSGLYGIAGSSGKGGNFVETMLRRASEGKQIRVVNDQVLTPTYTPDLAQKVSQLMCTLSYGLYHVTNSGECSWYEFARKIFLSEGLKVDLIPVATKDFPSSVRRPAYSVLDNAHLRASGLEDMPHWEDALRRYLRARAHCLVESRRA